MAKFKLRPELVQLFRQRKIINPGTGLIRITIPYKVNRISGERAYALSFNPSTHCLQTKNDYTAMVLRKKTSPKIKTNGVWRFGDPGVAWFMELPDADPMPSILVEGSTEVLPRKNRKIIKQYLRETGAEPPPSLEPTPAEETMHQARLHAAEKARKL